MTQPSSVRSILFNRIVIVSTLGYLVDIFDLVLFSVVRQPSLAGIGVPADQVLNVGIRLLNIQMIGMLLGGILWGVLGDKRGRVSVLFASIFLYSAANIANAFVTSVDAYALLRFISGLGLAGEFGIAVTLVGEALTKETRGIGTTIIAGVGILGAASAGLASNLFDWKTCYLIGGGLGFVLLFFRMGMIDSSMFKRSVDTAATRGDFLLLFKRADLRSRYFYSIFIGLPIWFVIGMLVTFAPEFAKELGVQGVVNAGRAVQWTYVGGVLGDVVSGYLSQRLKRRKQPILYFLIGVTACIALYLNASGVSASTFYFICGLLGFVTGYWALFVTVASEQFGTNFRSTVTTTAPNFVRGAVVPLIMLFGFLKGHISLLPAAAAVACVTLVPAFYGLAKLKETFARDLDFIE